MSLFNKEWRYKRQDDYNIEKLETIPFEFDGIKKKVYSNVNLSIFTDDFCNADCKFCVAQLRFENRGQMYQKGKIISDEEYLNRLREVLIKIRPINPSVSITGGEPTKCKRLVPIIQILDELNFRKKTITTNGSGLLDISDLENKTILDSLIAHKFQHLNISRTHFDEDINQSIMKFESSPISNDKLGEIIRYSLKNNLRPRMSCLLLKDGIHTVEDMKNYLEYWGNQGVDNVIFRELMDFDIENMTNEEKKNYCLRNKTRLADVWEQIEKYSEFKPYLNILGYYYYVEIYKYGNIDCVSESADLRRLYVEKEKHPDIVYEMVFHPNGNLNGSWVDNEDILLKYNLNI